ncbi:MAG: hypothetical protein AB8B93_11455 [Pseudomonadales bacterium]
MTERKPTTAELLALRDGEPLPRDAQDAIAATADAGEQLAQLRGIQQALQTLPDQEPPAGTWEQIQARLAAGPQTLQPLALQSGSQGTTVASLNNTGGPAEAAATSWQLRYPMATAAGVFFAAVLVSLLWLPQIGSDAVSQPSTGPTPALADISPALPSGALPSGAMADLIDRSQRLEAVARLPVARAIDGQERSRQALLYRIADLDAQLNSLIEEEAMDPALKEKLWRQRVDLLETLVAVQQAQMAQAADLY